MISRESAAKILRKALRFGGEFAEIFVEDRRVSLIQGEDGRIEKVSSGRDVGAGVRVVSGEGAFYAYTDSLEEPALAEAAETAGRAAEGRTGAGVIDLRPWPRRAVLSARIRPEEVETGRKAELIERADRAARAVDPLIRQVSHVYSDLSRRIWVANSAGVFIEDEQILTRLVVTAVAAREGIIQTGTGQKGAGRGFELFEDFSPEEIGRRAARQAMTNLYASPAPSGPMKVVMCNGWGGVLFHEACGHGLEADAVQKGASVFAGRIGETVASPVVTAIDDGRLPGGWGSFGYDDEGQPSQRNVIIENGVLQGYLYDVRTGHLGGRSSSGNGRRQTYQHPPQPRMTNTFIAPGKSSRDDILAETGEGFYAADLRGGQVNTATGDFVFTVSEGYLIKNGRLAEPVRGATLIGNGPQVLKLIDRVGNDLDHAPGTCGKGGQGVPASCGQPTLRIAEMIVGGTQIGSGAAGGQKGGTA